MANWCVSGASRSYSVKSSSATPGAARRRRRRTLESLTLRRSSYSFSRRCRFRRFPFAFRGKGGSDMQYLLAIYDEEKRWENNGYDPNEMGEYRAFGEEF